LRCGAPRRGWRHVGVPARRTTRDWAAGIRALLDVPAPEATRLPLVRAHLNPHTGASLYEALPPQAARRWLDRGEIPHPPKHASGLTRAAIDIGVLQRPCLHRRRDNADGWRRAIRAWEERRNQPQVKIHWRFPSAVARHKLKKLYPVIDHSTLAT
jgi:hypothetical protein